MSKAVTAVGIINLSAGRILLLLGLLTAWETFPDGSGEDWPIVLPVLVIPPSLTMFSGAGIWLRRRWAPVLTVFVGAAWALVLGASAYLCMIFESDTTFALPAFLGAIYGLICALMMLNRANREEFG